MIGWKPTMTVRLFDLDDETYLYVILRVMQLIDNSYLIDHSLGYHPRIVGLYSMLSLKDRLRFWTLTLEGLQFNHPVANSLLMSQTITSYLRANSCVRRSLDLIYELKFRRCYFLSQISYCMGGGCKIMI